MPPDAAPARVRRSARAHESVLGAAIELLRATPYDRLTVDAVAKASGVSKATIYRWWPHKAAIVVEALLWDVGDAIAFPDTGSLREDLTRQAAALADALRDPGSGGSLLALLARAQHDADLAVALRAQWQEPRRDAGRAAVQRGVRRGEVPAHVDVEALLDAVYGAVYLRVLFGHAETGPAALAAVVDQAVRGAAGAPTPTPTP
jgi:AcrR family transcriptional regulator